MANLTTRHCAWCNREMVCSRSSKRLCRQQCHVEFGRWRQKVIPDLTPEAAFKFIQSQPTHPNPKYKGDTQDEQTTYP
jgi:hypothetical protein